MTLLSSGRTLRNRYFSIFSTSLRKRLQRYVRYFNYQTFVQINLTIIFCYPNIRLNYPPFSRFRLTTKSFQILSAFCLPLNAPQRYVHFLNHLTFYEINLKKLFNHFRKHCQLTDSLLSNYTLITIN